MGDYWRKVFARAWSDTKQSFGWNQKTALTALAALAGIAVAFIQLGLVAAIASATGLFWTALPIAIAGLLLFVWNFISAPASLYNELSKEYGERIAALELALANLRQLPLDYAAWRHVDRLSLRDAAFLWCELSPASQAMPSNVNAWFNALAAAIAKDELDFEPQYRESPPARERQREYQKRNPKLDTIVTRKALKAFANIHGYDPKFLRDA